MVALATSASVNMALTFSLERGLCANVRLEKLWPSLHAKQISSQSGLRPKRPRMMPPNWKKVIWSLEFAAERYQPNFSSKAVEMLRSLTSRETILKRCYTTSHPHFE